jgi:hypothetical protein
VVVGGGGIRGIQARTLSPLARAESVKKESSHRVTKEFKPKTEFAARHQMQTNGHEKHKETQEVDVNLVHAEICIFSRLFVLFAAILPVVFSV